MPKLLFTSKCGTWRVVLAGDALVLEDVTRDAMGGTAWQRTDSWKRHGNRLVNWIFDQIANLPGVEG